MHSVKDVIEYEDFAKLDIRVGTVKNASVVANSQKLLELTVDFGDFTRTILTGMQKWYGPDDFEGKQFLFIVNLAPRKMAGKVSEGMLLSVGLDHEQKPILLSPSEETVSGEGIS